MAEPACVAGGPDLFAALAASWPAGEVVELGPWRLRRGWGGGRRASAVTLERSLGDPGPAEDAMRLWGERPIFMVRDGEAALEAALAERGYRSEAPTVLYAGAASGLAYRAADLAVIDCDGPVAIMAEIWAAAGIGPARLDVMARVTGPKRFLLGRLSDRAAGAGFVSVHGGVAMLNGLVVSPGVRRRGLGRRLTQWAAGWAVEQGAEVLALTVEAENAPARALYDGLGMVPAGGYHYRVAPEGRGT